MNLKRALLSFGFVLALSAASKTPLTDDALNDKIKIKLAGDTEVKGGALGIDVKAGVVTLTGKVETEKQKSKAEKLTRKIGGVKSVDNRIQVAPR